MKTLFANGPWPKLQRHWDIRAAGNFIGGGTGSGLIIFAAVAALSGQPFALPLLAGLASVAMGLTMVLLEIGRPWRAFNVFFHPQTSWMTREGVVALPLFACGGPALLLHWSGAPALPVLGLTVAAGLTAIGFVTCQARILSAARGIPAWREASLRPFIIGTGLAEGAGVLTLLAVFGQGPAWAADAALPLLAFRLFVWHRYRQSLVRRGAPAASLEVLQRFQWRFLMAHGIAALLLVGALLWPETWATAAAAAVAGLLTTAIGWLAKLTIVTKAAVTQGFAIPRTPVRGRGQSRAGDKPGWQVP